MVVDPAIKDPARRAMIEDALLNNVGTGDDEFADHPDTVEKAR